MQLSNTQIETYKKTGYLVLPRQIAKAFCEELLAVTNDHLARDIAPVEYEADLGYEGAPKSRESLGGRTIRRLRDAWHRDPVFQRLAKDPDILSALHQLLGEAVCITLAHHNSVMTKHPTFGTATGWHRDIRYWSFPTNNLISVWLALGPENSEDGGLSFIPGSHLWQLKREQMDDLDFLRPDYPDNQQLIQQGISLNLQQGDVILFHSGLFHSAGRNNTDHVKCSVVFAYHGKSNPPIANTRSSESEDILLEE